MNAHGNIEFGGQGRPVSGMPEILAVPARASAQAGSSSARSSTPSLAGTPASRCRSARPSPRGLTRFAVAACRWWRGCPPGRWGHHLSRGRLGAWKVQGKAVWFALRIPPGSDLATQRAARPAWFARDRRARGGAGRPRSRGRLGPGHRAMGGDLAVLSVSRQLTVWCRGDIVWWQEPDGGYDRLTVERSGRGHRADRLRPRGTDRRAYPRPRRAGRRGTPRCRRGRRSGRLAVLPGLACGRSRSRLSLARSRQQSTKRAAAGNRRSASAWNTSAALAPGQRAGSNSAGSPGSMNRNLRHSCTSSLRPRTPSRPADLRRPR